jgi:hypothetical protein
MLCRFDFFFFEDLFISRMGIRSISLSAAILAKGASVQTSRRCLPNRLDKGLDCPG